MTISTGIMVMVAMTIGGTLAIAVIYAIYVRRGEWWRELLSLRVLPFVFVGLAVGATTLGIGLAARRIADDGLRLAVDDIESDCDDQLNLLLHSDASAFVDAMGGTNRITIAEVQQLASFLGVDEVTVVDASGRIVISTAPGVQSGSQFFTDECRQRPYRALLTGHRTTVRQRFRPSTTDANRYMKYFATVLPRGGFLQIGYRWETFEREFPRYFLPVFEQRQVGNTGFCLVFDAVHRVEVDVPGHSEACGMTAKEIGLSAGHFELPPGQIFRARIFGTLCRCQFYSESVANRRILAVVPLAERQDPVLLLAATVALIIFGLFLVFRMVLNKFRQQQSRIDALREQEEAHRAADLALARSIQRAELRTDGTEGDGYQIATMMNAAREVGGDFYDYYELPDHRLVITIADVSGKGVPAAFFMMKARMTIKSCVYSASSLSAAIAMANVRLARHNPAEMFVTAWVGVYDRRKGTLEYVSAGHNPPLVCHAPPSLITHSESQGVEWLTAPRAAALGVFENAKYQAAQIFLAPGDRLFLYTDGVTEAMDAQGELFGNSRLVTTLDCASGDAARPEVGGLIRRVKHALDAFVGGAEPSDDITMLELDLR